MSSTVADVISVKGSEVYAVAGAATVYEAIAKMVRFNVGALVVMDAGRTRGLITERDYLRSFALQGRTSKTTTVEEVMSGEPLTVGLNTTVDECMDIMTKCRVRHLPVVAADRLVGIVSIGDVVNHLLTERATHIEHLTEYIQGRA